MCICIPWLQSWKRRFFMLGIDGQLSYHKSESSAAVLGSFDARGAAFRECAMDEYDKRKYEPAYPSVQPCWFLT